MKRLFTIIALLIASSVHAVPTATAEVDDGYGDWTRTCATAEDGGEVCQISQYTREANSEAMLFEISVGYVADSPTPVVFLTAPLGMYLPRGITLKLTDETLMTVAVQQCTVQGCLAVTTFDEAFLRELKLASDGLVVFGRNAEQNVGVPLSLVGFEKALASITPEAS